MESNVKKHKTSRLPLVISLTLLALMVASYFIFPGFQDGVDEGFRALTSGEEDRMREWVSQFGMWGPVVILFTMVIQMFMFIIPNVVLIMISILSYGPVWGGLLAWFGVFLASTAGFFIGNKLSPVVVQKLVSAKTQKTLKEFISEYGMKAIVVLRLSTLSNDGLSLVAGLLNMEYKRFISATLIGITPLVVMLAIFGRNGRIEKGLLWVGIVLVTGLVLYIWIDMRRKKRKNP